MPFSNDTLHPSLIRGIQDLGYVSATPIQKDAIPPALAGRDLLACAATGSGKTAAFLLPILQRLLDRPRGTTRALVLAPTRELAAQILADAQDLAKHTEITAAVIHGGVSMEPQERALRRGVDLVIATPGRLIDHFSRDYAKLSGLEYLVLDEADRMLDIGFMPAIRQILKHVPKPKQTLFFSATLPPEVRKLAGEILKNPLSINVERRAAPAEGVRQTAFPVPQELKPALLIQILRSGLMDDALVFTRTKHRADRLAKALVREGFKAERIHGNRSQSARTKALEQFRSGEIQVLVATDIAARGIDIEALGHVVNLDVPTVPEDYIHRVGRTGRAAATGDAFTFVSPEEEADFRSIERAVGHQVPRATIPGFDYSARPQGALEVPLKERIAAIRARKAEDRERAKAKADRRAAHEAKQGTAPASGEKSGSKSGGSGRRRRGGGKGPGGQGQGGAQGNTQGNPQGGRSGTSGRGRQGDGGRRGPPGRGPSGQGRS